MSKIESNWQFVEQYPDEPVSIVRARRHSLELGIEPVSPAVAAYLSSLVVLTGAKNICEVGTGAGVSGLALLRYSDNAYLTSIDVDPEHLRVARQVFTESQIPQSRVRLIEAAAVDIMPRLNPGSYDLLLIDANPDELLSYVEFGLQLVREGGTIVIPNALWHGQVADPAARDNTTAQFRDLLQIMADSNAVVATLSSVGGGVLTLTRTAN